MAIGTELHGTIKYTKCAVMSFLHFKLDLI